MPKIINVEKKFILKLTKRDFERLLAWAEFQIEECGVKRDFDLHDYLKKTYKENLHQRYLERKNAVKPN